MARQRCIVDRSRTYQDLSGIARLQHLSDMASRSCDFRGRRFAGFILLLDGRPSVQESFGAFGRAAAARRSGV